MVFVPLPNRIDYYQCMVKITGNISSFRGEKFIMEEQTNAIY